MATVGGHDFLLFECAVDLALSLDVALPRKSDHFAAVLTAARLTLLVWWWLEHCLVIVMRVLCDRHGVHIVNSTVLLKNY